MQWRRVAEELMESQELKAIYDQQFAASDKAMTYPEYYTVRRPDIHHMRPSTVPGRSAWSM